VVGVSVCAAHGVAVVVAALRALTARRQTVQ